MLVRQLINMNLQKKQLEHGKVTPDKVWIEGAPSS